MDARTARLQYCSHRMAAVPITNPATHVMPSVMYFLPQRPLIKRQATPQENPPPPFPPLHFSLSSTLLPPPMSHPRISSTSGYLARVANLTMEMACGTLDQMVAGANQDWLAAIENDDFEIVSAGSASSGNPSFHTDHGENKALNKSPLSLNGNPKSGDSSGDEQYQSCEETPVRDSAKPGENLSRPPRLLPVVDLATMTHEFAGTEFMDERIIREILFDIDDFEGMTDSININPERPFSPADSDKNSTDVFLDSIHYGEPGAETGSYVDLADLILESSLEEIVTMGDFSEYRPLVRQIEAIETVKGGIKSK